MPKVYNIPKRFKSGYVIARWYNGLFYYHGWSPSKEFADFHAYSTGGCKVFKVNEVEVV